ncbi:beta strand repeat-containing protein [Thiospirillum jenense]|uniref:Cadherin domain-containing protein n=1 Tax=Thiospirillum jenense TaxID=1653858 RepID=A0A839HIN9_9GAMM|nr:SwmB domain-containing protein [Thiospirillum jenense]MBB1125932.1 hypothetical protein [Thiospirillum jenense]
MSRPTTYGTLEKVLEIYAGVWSAAADAEGANYWVQQVEAWTTPEDAYQPYVNLVNGFFDQELVQAKYEDEAGAPLTGDAFLTALYQNVFMVDAPDAEGFAYWQAAMSAAGITDYNSAGVGALVMQMIDGMWASAATTETTQMMYQNWVTACSDFYDYQTENDLGGYSEMTPVEQQAFLATAANLVSGITSQTTPEEIQAAVDAASNAITPLAYTVEGAATSLSEGGTIEYTITSNVPVTEDVTLNYSLTGSGDNPATADDFSTATAGTVTIAAGSNTGTFSVGAKTGDGAEFTEQFTVTVTDGAAATIGSVTTLLVDTSTGDDIKPVVAADQTFNYNENQVAGATIATVVATDDRVAISGFSIVSAVENTTTPAATPVNYANYFAIDATGKLSLTAAGAAAAAAATETVPATTSAPTNDFETAPNGFKVTVTATDAAGNVSDAVDVMLEVEDLDDTPPAVTSAVIVGNKVTLNFGEALNTTVASPLAGDFQVTVTSATGGAGVNNVVGVMVESAAVVLTLASAAAAGETFKLAYTPGANTLQDVAGNDVLAFANQAVVVDTTAPVITAGQTISYIEGANDDVTDLVYKVQATDADSSIASFGIESGNTDGFFAIDGKGNITLTAAGLTGAANDYETTPNSFTLAIKATDVAGNSATENVVINVTNNPADDAEQPLELSLTSQTDALEGAGGNDTFIGDQTSVNPADVIDGNDGTDTARFTFAPNLDATYILTSREVEVFKLQNASVDKNVVFNAVNVAGMTTLTNNNSSETLTVTNVANNAAISVVGGDVETVETDDFKVTYQNSVNTGTAKIALSGVALDTLDLTDGFATYEIATTGTASSTINDFAVLTDLNADTDYDDAAEVVNLSNLASITFTGDKQLTVTSELERVSTYDATNNSGGVQVVIDDAANVKFTGGSGNDRVDVQAVGLTGSDNLEGGTGTDTLRIADGDMMSVVNASNVKGFEVLEVRATVGTNEVYNVDNIIASNALTGVTLSGGNGVGGQTFTVNNINAGATSNIKFELSDDDVLDNVTLTGKGFLPGGTSDTATLQLKNIAGEDGIDVGTLDFTDVDRLSFTSTSDGTPAAGEGNSIAELLAPSLTSITISGDQSFHLGTGVSTTALTSVDGSGLTGTTPGTYGLTLDASDGSAAKLEVKGTADADTVIASKNGTALTFYGNGGSDNVTLDSGQASNLQFTTATLGSGDMKAGNTITVSGAEAANDLQINLAAGVEAVLKSATTNLGAASANVALTTTIDANSNVAYLTGQDLNNNGTFDSALRIDLSGNGAFDANTDWQVIVDNTKTTGVTYNATTDSFTFDTLEAVAAVNQAPVFNPPGPFTVVTNAAAGTVVGNVVAVDPEAGVVTYGIEAAGNIDVNKNGIAPFTINAATGQLSVTDGSDLAAGSVSNLFIRATDSLGKSDTAQVTVNVTAGGVNPTYTLTPATATVNEGTAQLFTLATTNVVDGTQLNYAITGTGITTADTTIPLTGTVMVNSNAATLTLTPMADVATEGNETATITLTSVGAQVGNTAALTITDTSTAGGGGDTEVSMDDIGGTQLAPASFDADTGALVLTDLAATQNFVDVSNFGTDDELHYEITSESLLTVSNAGNDVTLILNNNGTVSQITLLGVATPNDLIFDVESFNLLPVGDITFPL